MKRLVDEKIVFDTKKELYNQSLKKQEIAYFLQDLFNKLIEDSPVVLDFQQLYLLVYRELLMGKVTLNTMYQMNNKMNQTDNSCIVFKNGELKDGYLNLFLPLKPDTTKEEIVKNFRALDLNDISYFSSIKNVLGNNRIEIKLDVDDIWGLKKIISSINNNKYFNDNKAKVLEFIPTVSGIGVTISDNFDYLFELSFCIASFLKKVNNADDISYGSFIKYFEDIDNPKDLENIFYCSVGEIEKLDFNNVGISYQEKSDLVADDIAKHRKMIEVDLINNFSFSNIGHSDSRMVESNYDYYLEKAIVGRNYGYFKFNGEKLRKNSKGWVEIYKILVDDLKINLDFGKINGEKDYSFINPMRKK